jgi:hypothetical protein
MAKLTTFLGSKLDLVVKSSDNFSVTLEILMEDDTSLSFEDLTAADNSQYYKLGAQELLIFTVLGEDYEPLLLACNAALDISGSVPVDDAVAQAFAHQRAFSVSTFLSDYAGNNTYEEEIINYYSGIETSPNLITSPSGAVIENGYLSKFYKPTMVEQTSEILPSATIGDSNIGNNYIAKGIISGVNPITISFDSDDFDLPKGNYKYELKQLSGVFSHDAASTMTPNTRVSYSKATTWMYGKFKVKE